MQSSKNISPHIVLEVLFDLMILDEMQKNKGRFQM